MKDEKCSSEGKDKNDRILRRLGYFVLNGQANGLQVFLTESGMYVYFAANGKIKFIDKNLVEGAFKNFPILLNEDK